MMFTRRIGRMEVTNVVEYSGPTHDPAVLFPELGADDFSRIAPRFAPQHYMTSMNRLIVSIQIWIVRSGSDVIVIDTGVGNFKKRAAPRMNMLNTLVLSWLEAAGARPDQVTHVVNTHLHSDHVGWNTRLVEGKWVPTFPNARYLMSRVDFDAFSSPDLPRNAQQSAASLIDSVIPVMDAGLVGFVEPGETIAGCLEVEPLPGHTPGHFGLRLRSEGREGMFCADVMHSPFQMALPDLNTAIDMQPDATRATRRAFLARMAERGALIMPCHFGMPYCGYVAHRDDGGFDFVPEYAGSMQ